MNIIAADISEIDVIQPLWEKLNAYNSDLHKRCFGESLGEKWEHKGQDFRARAKECRIKFDMVEIDDRIVGYCISSINKRLQGEIVSLYVLDEFRGRGIGADLVKEHIDWFKANQVKSVFLYVHPCNIGAIRFYWRFQFFSNSPLMELCESGQ